MWISPGTTWKHHSSEGAECERCFKMVQARPYHTQQPQTSHVSPFRISLCPNTRKNFDPLSDLGGTWMCVPVCPWFSAFNIQKHGKVGNLKIWSKHIKYHRTTILETRFHFGGCYLYNMWDIKHGSCPPTHLPQVGGFPTTAHFRTNQTSLSLQSYKQIWIISGTRGRHQVAKGPLPSGKGAHFHLGLTSAFLARNGKRNWRNR
jgi:hypothetical protein